MVKYRTLNLPVQKSHAKKPCKKIIKWHVLVVKSGETQENSPRKLLKYKPNSGSLIKLSVLQLPGKTFGLKITGMDVQSLGCPGHPYVKEFLILSLINI